MSNASFVILKFRAESEKRGKGIAPLPKFCGELGDVRGQLGLLPLDHRLQWIHHSHAGLPQRGQHRG